MSDIVIKVENLSKQYQLGQVGTGTLTRDLQRWYSRIRGKEDPTLKIGQENILSSHLSPLTSHLSPDFIWALRDINFEVKQGEVLGIIGKNGAGKSTLLKILSQVTSPTTGEIKVKGRIASLLEVGTGFHPELTGRENVFLNGAILGMTKSEIKSKFDEIVDFSGVEKYIDTPVKRYSSGMYVRLAFAVAAHLEPEILVVDEVLAVGDAEFQKKALGKMQDVSRNEGRTVLFVSHNMAAVQNLCKTGILLTNGRVEIIDQIQNVINKYLIINKTQTRKLSEIENRKGNGIVRFSDGRVKDIGKSRYDHVESFSNIQFEIYFKIKKMHEIKSSRIDLGINNIMGDRVAWLSSDIIGCSIDLSKEVIFFTISNLPLAPGEYNCNLYCEANGNIADWLINVLPFSVLEKDYYGNGKSIPSNQGNILINYTVC